MMNNNFIGPWPYVEAKHYNDWETIQQGFPHLKDINPAEHTPNSNIQGIVIRSANDDNVHKAIKYGIWTTTPKNKNKIEQLWNRKVNYGTKTYLFFSAVKSGMFEGIALLKSGYHQQTFPFWWENHTLKFKGYFEIEWIYIKDVNNKHFSGMYNMDGEEVTKSKDCDTLNSETANRMMEIFGEKKVKRNIFMDFGFMDERESQYIRKMYEYTYSNQYNMDYNAQRYDLGQGSNMMGGMQMNSMQQMRPMGQQMTMGQQMNPMHMNPMGQQMNPMGQQMNPMQMNPMGQQMNAIGMPPGTMRPNTNQIPGSNLGFQMNPVSKNSKKK